MTRTQVFWTLALLAAVLSSPPGAGAQAPAGWTTQTVGKQTVYTPPDLKDGELYRVIVFPRTAMGGAVITDFLDVFSAKEIAALGKTSGDMDPATAKSHNVASLVRVFTSKQGQPRLLYNTALSVDTETVRIVSVVTNQNTAAFKRYAPSLAAFTTALIAQEKADARTSGRGLSLEKTAEAPDGMTPGGKLVPGIYAGSGVYSDDGKIGNRYRVYLYPWGEASVCDEGGREYRFGHDEYHYDPVTGKLQIGITFTFNNNRTDPEREFCLYGRGADGKPYIHARSDRGYGYLTVILRYAGPTDRPSPDQQAAAKAAAEAEARRYKYVTAPGKGVQPAQIAGVFHHYDVQTTSDGVKTEDETYLLLRDGTVHDGLPVAPDEMDVSVSRRREPGKWGRWRRQGTQILAAWPDRPNHFEALAGTMATPGKPGERLSGRYAAGSTTGSALMGGSYRIWGVTFTPDGRFVKDNQGGSSSGTFGQTMNDFSVDTAYDDNGSIASFSAPGTVGYAKTKKKGSNRGGTYSISGYTLTLRYDSGRVARLPFFFESEGRKQLFFDGDTLGLSRD